MDPTGKPNNNSLFNEVLSFLPPLYLHLALTIATNPSVSALGNRYAYKGIAYAVIDRGGVDVHVFGTHMQSDDSGCSDGQAAQNRGEAADDWRAFLDKRNIPANELVIMAGDFNTKRDSGEFRSLLSRLDADQPTTYNGHAWTWDTKSNEIARYNYPDLPPEYIDYVFTDKKHKVVKSAVQTVLKVKTPKEYTINGVAYHEYSDHYPVQVVIEV